MIYGDIWWIYPASLPFHPSPWTSASMSEQHQSHILKLACQRHAPCSGMWISQFLPHLRLPYNPVQAFFFFSPPRNSLGWITKVGTLWHSLLPEKCLIAVSFNCSPWELRSPRLCLNSWAFFVAPLGRTELFGKIQPWWEAEAFWKTWPLSLASSKEAVLRTVSLIFNSQAGSVLWNSESSTNKVFSTSSQRRLEVLLKPCSSVPTSCCPADVQRPFSYQTFSQRSFFSQISVF